MLKVARFKVTITGLLPVALVLPYVIQYSQCGGSTCTLECVSLARILAASHDTTPEPRMRKHSSDNKMRRSSQQIFHGKGIG